MWHMQATTDVYKMIKYPKIKCAFTLCEHALKIKPLLISELNTLHHWGPSSPQACVCCPAAAAYSSSIMSDFKSSQFLL